VNDATAWSCNFLVVRSQGLSSEEFCEDVFVDVVRDLVASMARFEWLGPAATTDEIMMRAVLLF
jgi:hypothetical protein